MPDQTQRRWRLLRLWVKDNQLIHTVIGLVGNASFFVGSIFFIWNAMKPAGVGLFITGALFMLVGSAGDAIIKYEKWSHGSDDLAS